MASSMSGQVEQNPASVIGYPQDGANFASSGTPDVSHKKTVFFFHIINPLLTKFVRSRWLDTGHVRWPRLH